MWLEENYPEFLPGVLKLKIKDPETYPPLLFSEKLIEQFPAKKWWNLAKVKTSKKDGSLPNGFCDFFIKLHGCPPSSVSIERIFSTFGFVWNKTRNSLGAEKAEKLVKVYHYLKNEPNDW